LSIAEAKITPLKNSSDVMRIAARTRQHEKENPWKTITWRKKENIRKSTSRSSN
jgi:hypothetical protein